MVNNPYRVGKTQWAKWNDAGRVAFNEARDTGADYAEAVSAANATTKEAEEARRAESRGLLDVIGDAVDTVADVAAVVSPVVAVAKTVTRSRNKKGK